LLSELQQQHPDGAGVRQFIRILQLHQRYPADLVEAAITQALAYHCPHLDGVELCLRQLLQPALPTAPLDLSQHPQLQTVGQQPAALSPYNQLLSGDDHGTQSVA
jgi:hypothetical protein